MDSTSLRSCKTGRLVFIPWSNSSRAPIPIRVFECRPNSDWFSWAFLDELAVGAVYYLGAIVALAVGQINGGVTLVMPAAGIAAALIIRFRQLRWGVVAPAIFVASIAAQVSAGGRSIGGAIPMAAIDLAEVCLMAWVYRNRIRFPIPQITIAQAAHMTALFGMLIPALAALAASQISHAENGGSLQRLFADRWLADALGACLFGPPIILFSAKAVRRLVKPGFIVWNLFLSLMCLACCFIAVLYSRFPFVLVAISLLIASFSIGGFGTAVLSLACAVELIALWLLDIRPSGFGIYRFASSMGDHPIWALISALMPAIAVGLGSDDRRQASRALRVSERRFRESLEHSPIGAVIIDLDGRWTQSNMAIQKMLGYSAEELHSSPTFQLTHPEEHADIRSQRERLQSGEIEFYEAERRYLHRHGTWIPARTVVSLVRDEDGQALHYIAQVESVEKRRAAEQALLDERERLKTTLRAIADAVVTTDAEQRITYINAAAQEILGQVLQEVQRLRFNDVVMLTEPNSVKPVPDLLDQCIFHGTVARRDEAALLHRPDGSVCYVTQSVSPVHASDESLSGTVIVLHDVSSHYERDREVNHRAAHDVLTGLANRFEFKRRAKKAFDRARMLDVPAAVLAIDLDRFKAVNDAAGHAAGDAVLIRVSTILTSLVRQADTVARLGGDEFAIILDKCPPERAEALAHKILQALNPLEMDWDGATFILGASIGVAVISEAFADDAGWLAAADRACYEAKREGRGCIRAA